MARGGANPRRLRLPVLAHGRATNPLAALLGTLALLFANAFGAVATAYALTGSSLSIVPILLLAKSAATCCRDPHLGYALAFGMIVITGVGNALYIWMRTRAERWIK